MNATIYMVDSTTGQVLASKSVVGTHERKGMDVGYATGDWVLVESASIGYDVGKVSLSGELVKLQMRRKNRHRRGSRPS